MKPLIAVFAVLLMLAWIAGGALTSLTGSSDGPKTPTQELNAVAVKWDGGSLTNLQIEQLAMRRRIVNAFLQIVERTGGEMARQASVAPSPLRVRPLAPLPSTHEQGIEQSVVQTRLFADAARKAGMRVSNEAIVQYLVDLGRGNVTPQEMRDMLDSMQQRGTNISIDDVMSTLREEMLARNYIAANQYAFLTVTPEQRWKDWLRVNRRAVIEAAAIPVDSMLLDVKEPTDAELEEFFNKKDSQGIAYKDREPSPEIAYGTTELPPSTPGFAIPRKIDVQYIEGNYDTFVAKAEETITDDEIAKYYEANKDPEYIKADTSLFEDTGEKDAAKPEGATTPDAKGASEAKPADDKPADEQKPAEGQTPAAPDETPPPPIGEKTEAPAEGKQSSLDRGSRKSVFQLTAFQEDAPNEDAAKSDAPKSETPAATEAAPATDVKPVDPAPPATVGDTPPAAPSTSTSPLTGSGLPEIPGVPAIPGITTPAAAPAAPKKPLEFQPLDEVKDLIRKKLAGIKVQGELEKMFREIEQQLDGDFSKYLDAKITAEAEKKTPPAPPASLTDLAPLAAKYGLTSGSTGPLSWIQMRDTAVGKTGMNDPDNPQPFRQMLFSGKGLKLYQPVSTRDIFNNHFIASKKSDTPRHVPTLAEVREEVIKAWKLQKAAELAEKRAAELAKKAEEAKTPLPEFFANEPAIKVVRTDPFSELTGGDVGINQYQPTPFRLSQPDQLVAPGPEFMKRVFELKDGQVAAMLNHDRTIAYVVRLVEYQPTLNELRTAYLSEANFWPGINYMTQGHVQEVMQGLENDIVAGANVKWEREADKTEPEESQAESPEAG
jgi:hypothetical protein